MFFNKSDETNVSVKEQRPVYVPPTEISEEENCWKIRATMPGVSGDGLEITLSGNELKLRGKSADAAPQGMRLLYNEYEPGDYERTFTIPDSVKRDGISAEAKDGILVLTLPKAEAARPLRIPVLAR